MTGEIILGLTRALELLNAVGAADGGNIAPARRLVDAALTDLKTVDARYRAALDETERVKASFGKEVARVSRANAEINQLTDQIARLTELKNTAEAQAARAISNAVTYDAESLRRAHALLDGFRAGWSSDEVLVRIAAIQALLPHIAVVFVPPAPAIEPAAAAKTASSRSFTPPRTEQCSNCKGSGIVAGQNEYTTDSCSECAGRGWHYLLDNGEHGPILVGCAMPCAACGKYGHVSGTCPTTRVR